MKIQGTLGGVAIQLNKNDAPEDVKNQLEAQEKVLKGTIFIDIDSEISWEVIKAAVEGIKAAGGVLSTVRIPQKAKNQGGTKIIAKTVRSGGFIESTASVVVLADVNAGAEIIAADDIIVLGTLRGVAHAGFHGNDKAVIWAREIRSPQLRIANVLAQSNTRTKEDEENKPAEVAHLLNGQIVVRPWR